MHVPREEIAQRVRQLRYHLTRQDLEGAVILDALNFAYLSGFHLDVDTWERPVVLVIPRAGPTTAIITELSSHAWELARSEAMVIPDRVVVYREHSHAPEAEPTIAQWTQMTRQMLRNAGISRLIGSDRPDGTKPIAEADAEVMDVEPAIRNMRRVKSRAELGILRRSGEITDWAQERYRERLRPGRYIQEVDHEIATLLEIRAAEEFPKSHFKLLVISFSGPDSAYPHGRCGWPSQKIVDGHPVITNVAFRIDGLGVENERTWSVGAPTARFRNAFGVAAAAQLAGVAACAAGRPYSEIDASAQAVIADAGMGRYSIHRSGHGVGLGLHEYPADTAFNQTPMLADEVMAVEPGVYIPGLGGFRHSDTLVIGARGPEVLTQFPRDVESLTIA